MKKFSLTLLIVLLVLGSTMGQQIEKRKALYQKVDQDVPLAVLKAIEKNTPGLLLHEQEEPVVVSSTKVERKMPSQRVDRSKSYVVITKERSLKTNKSSKKTSYYDAEGNYVSSREVHRNTALPRIAINTMGREYDGWALVSNKVTINEKGGIRTVFYELDLKNGKDKEHILINEYGQIVKNRKMQIQDTLKARRQNSNKQSINIGSF